MRAVLILDLQALAPRQKSIAMQREIGGRVIENVVPALLRFEQKRESRSRRLCRSGRSGPFERQREGAFRTLDPKGVFEDSRQPVVV